MKKLYNKFANWIDELGIESGVEVPSRVLLGLTIFDNFDSRLQKYSISDWLQVFCVVVRLQLDQHPNILGSVTIHEKVLTKLLMWKYFYERSLYRALKPLKTWSSISGNNSFYPFVNSIEKEHTETRVLVQILGFWMIFFIISQNILHLHYNYLAHCLV